MIPDEGSGLAPRNHNQPPDPIEAMRSEMADMLRAYEKRRGEIVVSATKKQVLTRADAQDVASIVSVAQRVFDEIDAKRRELTDPPRLAANAGKAVADEFWLPADEALDALRARLKVWTDAEDDRIAAQQREQDEFMAKAMRGNSSPVVVADDVDHVPAGRRDIVYNQAQPVAPLPPIAGTRPAKRRNIRGDLGGVIAAVEVASYTVTDVRAIPDFILNSPTVHAAIIQVVKAMAKHMGDIPGVEKTTAVNNQIRS